MKVAFRADAGGGIGTGHLSRCLTLADELRDIGAQTRFVSRELPAPIAQEVTSRGHELVFLPKQRNGVPDQDLAHAHWLGTTQKVDAKDSLAALSDHAWDWLVVDHYALDARWERMVHAATASILVIDDLADRAHDGDVLLDQNVYSDPQLRYQGKVGDDCRILLGPRYALLRPQFKALREEVRPRDREIARLLIFFGGVDADNHTSSAVEAVAASAPAGIQVDVVIGATHPFRAGVAEACAKRGYTCHVQTPKMAELIAAADMAVASGGAATWERCCLGLPTLAFAVAANQERQISDAARVGLLYAPEWQEGLGAAIRDHLPSLAENPALRHAMSSLGMRTVDGDGARRVLRRMGCSDIKLRAATSDDEGRLFAWRNEPFVRQASRYGDPIAWSAHQRWFQSVIHDPNRVLLIGERGSVAIGVVRFDIAGDESEVSIYLAPGIGAAGAGSDLLRAAERRLAATRPDVLTIRAHVLGGNERSHRLFTGSDYTTESTWYSKRLNAK